MLDEHRSIFVGRLHQTVRGRANRTERRSPSGLVSQRVNRHLCGLAIVCGHLHGEASVRAKRAMTSCEQAVMVTDPLQGGIGKDNVALVFIGEVAHIAEREMDPRLELVAETVAQRRRALDHRGRRIETKRGSRRRAARAVRPHARPCRIRDRRFSARAQVRAARRSTRPVQRDTHESGGKGLGPSQPLAILSLRRRA